METGTEVREAVVHQRHPPNGVPHKSLPIPKLTG